MQNVHRNFRIGTLGGTRRTRWLFGMLWRIAQLVAMKFGDIGSDQRASEIALLTDLSK
jgi:hypothetical protein